MIVKCEQCKTRFRLADEKVPPSGVRVRCARCLHVFRAHRVSALQPHSHASPFSAQMFSVPPVEEDPFAFFGEPTQQTGTSEPTRPGIFLPGVEASRRAEESKAPVQPPRVPLFGGGGGANISKLLAEKMAAKADGATHLEASSLFSQQAGDLLAETAKLSNAIDTIRIEYLSPETADVPSPGDATLSGLNDVTLAGLDGLTLAGPNENTMPGQKASSFSTPSSPRVPLHQEGGFEENLTLEDASRTSEEGAPREFSAQEFFQDASHAEGTLASLLSAASEDIVQDKEASELRKADESEIRRAFVQSTTKVKRRKRLHRFLRVLTFLLAAVLLLSGGVIYWKEGQLVNRTNGRIDWKKSFSWERLKKNLFSEAAKKEMAQSLYAMHVGQQVFSVHEDSTSTQQE